MGHRAGIIGYGLAGRVFHAPILRSAGFEIVGVVTRDTARTAQAKADHPGAVIARTVDELVKLGLDLVVVASTNNAHASNAMAAIDAGIPVVVDKPVGRDLEETRRLIAYAGSHSVPLTAYYSRRWDSESLTTARVIREGVLGGVHRIESRFDRWRPELRPGAWREQATPDAGGGLLLDLQTHLVSQALIWAGPAKVAFAAVRSVRGGADDDVTIVLAHSNGIQTTLIASAVSGYVGPRIRVFGNRGALVIDGLDPQESLLTSGGVPVDGHWQIPIETPAYVARGEHTITIEPEQGDYPAFYRACAKALIGEGEWPVPATDILEVATIIDQARDFANG